MLNNASHSRSTRHHPDENILTLRHSQSPGVFYMGTLGTLWSGSDVTTSLVSSSSLNCPSISHHVSDHMTIYGLFARAGCIMGSALQCPVIGDRDTGYSFTSPVPGPATGPGLVTLRPL